MEIALPLYFRIGVDADPNCFILLPCGFDNTSDYLPPLQKPDEPLLQRPEKEVKVSGKVCIFLQGQKCMILQLHLYFILN